MGFCLSFYHSALSLSLSFSLFIFCPSLSLSLSHSHFTFSALSLSFFFHCSLFDSFLKGPVGDFGESLLTFEQNSRNKIHPPTPSVLKSFVTSAILLKSEKSHTSKVHKNKSTRLLLRVHYCNGLLSCLDAAAAL